MRPLSTYILFLLTATMTSAHAQLCINEVMQSNVYCVMDDLNEMPDSWVELYNIQPQSINLKGFAIGTTNNYADAYVLPSSVPVAAHGHSMIYCDKENKGLHTNFRLNSGKGAAVYLFNKQGIVIDSLTNISKQPAPNISFGRKTDGADEWGYQLTPTPATSNCGEITDEDHLLGAPLFSLEGKVVVDKQLSLTLSLPADTPNGTEIRYTTNGTEPTKKSAVWVSGKSMTFSKTTVIRAKLFCRGWLSPISTTHSYIFHPRQQTLPIVSIVTNNNYLYDNNIGIYVNGTYSTSLKNYEYNWRRPINIEYFDESNTAAAFNQLCETRVQGGASRGSMIKSLAVYANKRFGEKHINYEFFPTEKPGITKWKSILLRNSGNDFDYCYFRDAAIQHNMGTNTDLDWQGWQPAIVYVNGTYLGMLNVRERTNEDHIWSNYNQLEDVDVIENWGSVKQGTDEQFEEFKSFVDESANQRNTDLDEYEQLMDVDEWMNVMIMNIWHNNLDFPGNNIVQWRPRTADGRWRWIAKDTDFGLGLYNRSYQYGYLDWLYNHDYDPSNNWANESQHTRLFRRLMIDQRCRDRFIDRITIYMHTFLNGDALGTTIDSMYNVIKDEYPHHRKLINQWWPNHEQEVNAAKQWATNRTTFMKQYIKDYFHIDTPLRPVIINAQWNDEGENYMVKLNDVALKDGKYNGQMFGGREIRLSANARHTDDVLGWQVKFNVNGVSTEQFFPGHDATFTTPDNISIVHANLVTSQTTDISTITSFPSVQPDATFSITGIRTTNTQSHGIYIQRHNGEVKKIIRH